MRTAEGTIRSSVVAMAKLLAAAALLLLPARSLSIDWRWQASLGAADSNAEWRCGYTVMAWVPKPATRSQPSCLPGAAEMPLRWPS